MRKANCILMVLTLVFLAAPVGAEIKLGVNAPRGELDAMTQWGELGNYLAAEMGDTVTLVPLKVADLVKACAQGQIDYVIANPIQGVVLVEKYKAAPLVTLNNKNGANFAGVILAAKDSGIKTSADLKGKSIMALDKSSAGAYIFQVYHMVKAGVDPRTAANLVEAKKQDDTPLAVKAGMADAAFIRTGILEAMQKEGKLSIDEFIIVDERKDPDFSFVHSTVLYPEWFLFTLTKAPAEASAKLKSALLKLTPDSAVSKAAGIKGFVEAASLDGIREALQTLKAPPFDN